MPAELFLGIAIPLVSLAAAWPATAAESWPVVTDPAARIRWISPTMLAIGSEGQQPEWQGV
ncbi:MAG: hypothetical protein RLZZ440_714, partial [Planctomycetota bacterium]